MTQVRSRRRPPEAEGGRRWRALVMALPPGLLIAFFAGLPIALAFGYSIGHGGGLNSTTALIAQHQYLVEDGWGTTKAYEEVFASGRFREDLWTTVSVTVVATLIVLALALAIALYLRLRGGVLARSLSVLAVVPMFIPVVISSWAIVTFYSADGFLRTLLAQVGVEGPVWAYSITAVTIGQVWTNLPFAVLMIASGVQAVPDSVIDAARDSGAGLARTTRSIILPMAMVPIIIATTFTAIGIIGSFTVPYFVGPNAPTMLGVDMTSYFQAFNRPQQSIVMAFVVFAMASGIAAFYIWANYRQAKDRDRV